MALANYSDLTASVADWLNRDDLTARIPDYIALFEARMNRTLRVPAMEVELTASTTSETYALPADCLSVRQVALDADPDTVLIPMSPVGLRATYPNAASGTTAAYAITGTNLKLAPPPSSAVTLVINYYRQIPALTSTANTNWLLTAHPDAYLFGALAMAEAHLMNDDRVGFWKSELGQIVAEIMSTGTKYRTPGSPLAMRGAAE